MKIWTSEGHLSELALELRATGEVGGAELEGLDAHVAGCPACRAGLAEWRGLLLALAALRDVEPSSSFDAAVLEQVRRPAAAILLWRPRLARRLRRAAMGAAAAWVAALAGGAAWLGSRVDVPATVLLARFVNGVQELLLGTVIKVGAILHLSGLTDLWAELPSPTLAGALATLAALSALAVWTLYRVTGYQPSEVNAHG